MISYAQLREDVLLHRALCHVNHEGGFYIDVGAYHPTADSVTRHFYDHGWHGINVEASPELFIAFEKERLRDINLQVAVSDRTGEATFFDVEGQLSTLEPRFAGLHTESGLAVRSYIVPTMTLTDICEAHAPREIHFLKIDIEGYEGAAIRGMDFRRFRPWILVIESTEPNNWAAPTYHEWDSTVRGAAYRFVYTDVLNRYYVAEEHPELLEHFSIPADNYVHHRELSHISQLEAALMEMRENLAVMTAKEAGRLAEDLRSGSGPDTLAMCLNRIKRWSRRLTRGVRPADRHRAAEHHADPTA